MADPVSETGFEVNFTNDAAVMQMPVRLAGVEAVAFKDACQQLLQESSLPEKIVFDFSQTTFIDSSGIGAIVSNHKSARLQEIKLVRRCTPCWK